MEPEEQLADVTADLLSMRAHEMCVLRLLSGPPGEWHSLGHVCAGDSVLLGRLAGEEIAGATYVVWLPFAASAYGDGFCTITFFSEQFAWSSTAIFNRGGLLARVRADPGQESDD